MAGVPGLFKKMNGVSKETSTFSRSFGIFPVPWKFNLFCPSSLTSSGPLNLFSSRANSSVNKTIKGSPSAGFIAKYAYLTCPTLSKICFDDILMVDFALYTFIAFFSQGV
jgi:hypothetical protein